MPKLLPLLLLFSTLSFAKAPAPTSTLLPTPKQLTLSEGDFRLARKVSISVSPAFASDFALSADNALTRFLDAANLTPETAKKTVATVSINKVAAISGAYDYPLAHFDNEAYEVLIGKNEISISAVSPIGAIRALQTLELLTTENPRRLPCMSVKDWPAFKLRGLMHDAGRSYISVGELLEEIDLLARFKVNVFLWHLTDKHGFRFESRLRPEVNTNFSPTRSSEVYTQEECRLVQDYALSRGMMVIPEIDMPGHSARFEGATGHTMASPEGRAILKDVLSELAATFDRSPYIHIGGDETKEATEEFINEMADHVHSLGRKVVLWNCYKYPFTHVDPTVVHCDLTTNWATAGTLSPGVPNVDMRYFYLNHTDVFADVAGIYRSSIFYEGKGNADLAGQICGIWNDRLISDETLIVRENNLYAALLASAERGWVGGERPYIEDGGCYVPLDGKELEEFTSWERRFLFHKDNTLKAAKEKIPYVKQTHVVWAITPAFDNEGDKSRTFAIENDPTPSPSAYPGTTIVRGAGIWLNHIWAGIVPGALSKEPQPMNQTRYAWTYAYSPKAQTLGAYIQTYEYSRSDRGLPPEDGQWDMRGSRLWVNDTEIIPTWHWTTEGYEEETELGNPNFTARPLVMINLKKGWNKVLFKLPLVPTAHQRPGKWQFTFILTDPTGSHAAEGIKYSPNR